MLPTCLWSAIPSVSMEFVLLSHRVPLVDVVLLRSIVDFVKRQPHLNAEKASCLKSQEVKAGFSTQQATAVIIIVGVQSLICCRACGCILFHRNQVYCKEEEILTYIIVSLVGG